MGGPISPPHFFLDATSAIMLVAWSRLLGMPFASMLRKATADARAKIREGGSCQLRQRRPSPAQVMPFPAVVRKPTRGGSEAVLQCLVLHPPRSGSPRSGGASRSGTPFVGPTAPRSPRRGTRASSASSTGLQLEGERTRLGARGSSRRSSFARASLAADSTGLNPAAFVDAFKFEGMTVRLGAGLATAAGAGPRCCVCFVGRLPMAGRVVIVAPRIAHLVLRSRFNRRRRAPGRPQDLPNFLPATALNSCAD